MRWARRGTAWLLLTVIVLAPPAALLTGAVDTGWAWPTSGDVTGWLDDPLTPRAVAAAVVLLASLLWAAITVLVLIMVARAAARALARVRRMPLPSPAQATATSMAGAAALSAPAYATDIAALGPPPTTASTSADHLRNDGGTVDEAAVASGSGVDLPDGSWIPPGTADLIGSAASLMWLRRRRFYPLAPPRAGDRDDTAKPVPPVVAAVQAAPPELRGQVGEQHIVGLDDDGPLTLDHLPAGGLALVGPGAGDAARGLLIPLLLSAGSTSRSASVWITRVLFERLVGRPGALPSAFAGLHLAETVADLLEERRSATTRSAGPDSGIALLIADVADDPYASTQLASAATRIPNTISLLLNTAALTAWHVRADGTVHLPLAPEEKPGEVGRRLRLCVLSRQASADLLDLARSTHATATGHGRLDNAEHTDRANVTVNLHGEGEKESPLQLTLLGTVRLTYLTRPVTLRRSAALQILAYLAVYPAGATAGQLGAAVWPGLRPSTVTNRVYTTISELRRTLQDLTGSPIVNRNQDTYLLDQDSVTVDLWHHRHRVQAAAAALTTANRPAALRAIIDGAPEDLAAGQSWPWIIGPRDAVRRDVIDAYAALADISPPADRVALLTAALRVDPLNEDLHRRALYALAANADHDAIASVARAYNSRVTAAGMAPPEGLLALAESLSASSHRIQ